MLCSECDSALDIDKDDMEEGDSVTCDECGAEYEVVGTDPLELARTDEEIDEDAVESGENDDD